MLSSYINMNGDFYDLEKKLNKTRDPLNPDGHCSGFVKVAPGNKDIFISQVCLRVPCERHVSSQGRVMKDNRELFIFANDKH